MQPHLSNSHLFHLLISVILPEFRRPPEAIKSPQNLPELIGRKVAKFDQNWWWPKKHWQRSFFAFFFKKPIFTPLFMFPGSVQKGGANVHIDSAPFANCGQSKRQPKGSSICSCRKTVFISTHSLIVATCDYAAFSLSPTISRVWLHRKYGLGR